MKEYLELLEHSEEIRHDSEIIKLSMLIYQHVIHSYDRTFIDRTIQIFGHKILGIGYLFCSSALFSTSSVQKM